MCARRRPLRTIRPLAMLALALVGFLPAAPAFADDEPNASSPTTTDVSETTDPASTTEPAPTTSTPTDSTTTAPTDSNDVPAPSTMPATSTTTTSTTTTTSVPTTTTTTTTSTITTTPALQFAAPMLMAAAAPAIPAPTCRTYTTVKLGTRSDPARCVETRLTQYGYWLQGPDDNFDATAVTALEMFQSREGLPVTGIANEATLHALGIWQTPPTRPAPTCRTYTTVQLGTRSDPARCVETRLRQYGFWLVGPDDNFDATAVAALKIFQARTGLLSNGVADKATLQALSIWTDPPRRPAPTCSTAWTVTLGSTGGPSRCVEQRLVQYGYWLSGPDDVFDQSAVNALRILQAREGMLPTGVADVPTLQRLGIYRANNWPAPTCKVHYAVSRGTTGATAQCVEQRLAQLGYWMTGPDQVFDSTAVTALRLFQYKNSLAADGVAGQRTLSRLGIYDPVPPPFQPLPANSGTGRRVVYSRAQQRIWAVNADGTIAKSHRVSGRTYEPYAGTYHVYSRSLYTYSANDPSVRWRYMIRFTYGFQGGRIGFHEIPNRNGVPLQSAEQLGLPLSAGCVRQSTADAAWLWNWAPVGTKVVVL